MSRRDGRKVWTVLLVITKYWARFNHLRFNNHRRTIRRRGRAASSPRYLISTQTEYPCRDRENLVLPQQTNCTGRNEFLICTGRIDTVCRTITDSADSFKVNSACGSTRYVISIRFALSSVRTNVHRRIIMKLYVDQVSVDGAR